MLLGVDAGLRRRVALAQRAAGGAPSSSSPIVAAFLVEREEAGEEHDLAGRAQARARPVPSVSSTVVRSSRADAIWLASARFQTSS